MNILLSAYACEPNKGSEPGVGWGWAIELAKQHNVWVLTKGNNKPTIEKYQKQYPQYKNEQLHFIYIDLPSKLTWWKKGRRGMRLYYMFWQKKAFKIAKKLHKKINFDLVQHVTFVSYTQPTYMYKLDIPMIWGPISGGENIPKKIDIKMSIKERLVENLRIFSQKIALIMPSIRKTMAMSNYILVATEETKCMIPSKYQKKVFIIPAIGLEKLPEKNNNLTKDNKIRIIMAGRLIYWKAFDIGLKAYLKIVDKYPNTELHILGEGDKKNDLKKIAGSYLNKQVFFEEPISHEEIYKFYQKYDIFLNTTLRDSGCMTMMEAMASGLSCIYLETGGPKIIGKYSKNSKGIFPTNYEETIVNLSKELEHMLNEDTSKMRKNLDCNIEKLLFRNRISIFEEMYQNMKSDKIKVLQKVYGLKSGGVETIITSLHQNIDRDKFHFDYLTDRYDCDHEFYDEKVKSLDGVKYNLCVENESGTIKKCIKKILAINNFLKENKYDIVHTNESPLHALLFAIVAKKCGVKRIIVHAHTNNEADSIKFSKIFNSLIRELIPLFATDLVAITPHAARWYYPERYCKSGKVKMIKNGIYTNKFIFAQDVRNKTREKLDLNDKFVIGHVGRLSFQKNQEFLIEIFKEILKINEKAFLIMVGEGENLDVLRKKISEANLDKYVMFYGVSDNVEALMQAMDVFVMPSRFEGLGIVAIEAQAAGLITVCSKQVPQETCLSPIIKYIDLEDGAKVWAKEILELTEKYERKDMSQYIINNDYDIKNSAKKLEKLYLYK